MSALTRAAALVALFALLTLACTGALRRGDARYHDPRLAEPSGLAASVAQPGVFWTHNDSGDGPVLYATTVDGRLLGRYVVEGASAVDWEAITVDDRGHLYIGDIGNNGNDRRDLVVHRVPEPTIDRAADRPASGTLRADRALRFYYPEQQAFPPEARNFDAEALFWAPHPDTGEGTLYLLTKHRGDLRTVLYRFDRLDAEPQPLVARGSFEVGGDPDRYGGMVTGADLSPDGRHLAVLTYHALFIFARPAEGDDWLAHLANRVDLDQDVTVQAEAVAWHGAAVVFTNEQGAIFRVDDPLAPRSERFP